MHSKNMLGKNNKKINNSLITFVPICEEVTTDYFRWFNDPRIRKFLTPNTPTKKEDIRRWIKNNIQSETREYYSIIYDGKNIGHVGLKWIDRKRKTADAGIIIGEVDFWNLGIGKKSTNFIINVARNMGLKKITADVVDTKNVASIKILRNAGFVVVENNENHVGFKYYIQS